MKLFIDSGNIKDIERLADIGIIDGGTTNPPLPSNEPGDYPDNRKQILGIVQGPARAAGCGNWAFPAEVRGRGGPHPTPVIEAAGPGADIATCPPGVMDALFNHPLTNIGLEKFLKDWDAAHAVKA